MRRLLLTSVSAAALMLTVSAQADTSSLSTTATGMGVLENDYVKAGVNGTTGTLGSGGNTSPGLLYDSTGTGTFNTSYDYLTPGSPFDGWSIKIDGSNSYNNNASTSSATWLDSDGLTNGDGTLIWTGTNPAYSGWEVEHTYSLGATSEHIEISTSITAGSAADDVYFGKYIDPDAVAAAGDSSATDNVLGYGVIPDTNVAFSEATVSRYALGLYSTDTNVTAGINNWDQNADSYDGSKYTDADGNEVNYGTGDDTIGLSWHWTGVSAGDILEASYAYIFGPSAFDAADTAIDAGAGGGDTSTTDSWGTLTDVGSATDAAESGGTAEPVITYSDPVVDTDRPVLTASLTHHEASDDGAVQTIAREKTTSVTTPMEIITYTDGVETSRAVTDSVVVTTVTNPDSYTGRVDQHSVMATINDGFNRSMHVNPWQAGGAQTEWGQMWINGGAGKMELDNGYSADTKTAGIQVEIQPMAEWRVNINLAKSDIELTGIGSLSGIQKANANIGSIYQLGDFTFVTDIGIARNLYDSSRSIGTSGNTSQTEGVDMMAKQRIYYSLSPSVIPFVGAGVTKTTVDGFTESGWVVSARTVAEVDERTEYAEGGLRLQHTFGNIDVFAQGSATTDDWMFASAGVNYNIVDYASIGITGNASKKDDLQSIAGQVSVHIKF